MVNGIAPTLSVYNFKKQKAFPLPIISKTCGRLLTIKIHTTCSMKHRPDIPLWNGVVGTKALPLTASGKYQPDNFPTILNSNGRNGNCVQLTTRVTGDLGNMGGECPLHRAICLWDTLMWVTH